MRKETKSMLESYVACLIEMNYGCFNYLFFRLSSFNCTIPVVEINESINHRKGLANGLRGFLVFSINFQHVNQLKYFSANFLRKFQRERGKKERNFHFLFQESKKKLGKTPLKMTEQHLFITEMCWNHSEISMYFNAIHCKMSISKKEPLWLWSKRCSKLHHKSKAKFHFNIKLKSLLNTYQSPLWSWSKWKKRTMLFSNRGIAHWKWYQPL